MSGNQLTSGILRAETSSGQTHGDIHLKTNPTSNTKWIELLMNLYLVHAEMTTDTYLILQGVLSFAYKETLRKCIILLPGAHCVNLSHVRVIQV